MHHEHVFVLEIKKGSCWIDCICAVCCFVYSLRVIWLLRISFRANLCFVA